MIGRKLALPIAVIALLVVVGLLVRGEPTERRAGALTASGDPSAGVTADLATPAAAPERVADAPTRVERAESPESPDVAESPADLVERLALASGVDLGTVERVGIGMEALLALDLRPLARVLEQEELLGEDLLEARDAAREGSKVRAYLEMCLMLAPWADSAAGSAALSARWTEALGSGEPFLAAAAAYRCTRADFGSMLDTSMVGADSLDWVDLRVAMFHRRAVGRGVSSETLRRLLMARDTGFAVHEISALAATSDDPLLVDDRFGAVVTGDGIARSGLTANLGRADLPRLFELARLRQGIAGDYLRASSILALAASNDPTGARLGMDLLTEPDGGGLRHVLMESQVDESIASMVAVGSLLPHARDPEITEALLDDFTRDLDRMRFLSWAPCTDELRSRIESLRDALRDAAIDDPRAVQAIASLDDWLAP